MAGTIGRSNRFAFGEHLKEERQINHPPTPLKGDKGDSIIILP